MKVFSVTTGKARTEFSVHKVGEVYQARVNDLIIYESTSYSVCSEIITEEVEDVNDGINVFTMNGAVH